MGQPIGEEEHVTPKELIASLAGQEHTPARGANDLAESALARVEHEVIAWLIRARWRVAIVMPDGRINDLLIPELPPANDSIRVFPFVRVGALTVDIRHGAGQPLRDQATLNKPFRDAHDRRRVQAPGKLGPSTSTGAQAQSDRVDEEFTEPICSLAL